MSNEDKEGDDSQDRNDPKECHSSPSPSVRVIVPIPLNVYARSTDAISRNDRMMSSLSHGRKRNDIEKSQAEAALFVWYSVMRAIESRSTTKGDAIVTEPR
jgi:hypothetical protein